MAGADDCEVMLIEDDPDFRASLEQLLELEDLPVRALADPRGALATLTAEFGGVLVSDIRLPGLDGEQVLREVKRIDEEIPVILMTGHGDIPMAVRALKAGAYDFLEKPFANADLLREVKHALQIRRAVLEKRRLSRQLEHRDALVDTVVGTSKKMQAMRIEILAIGSSSADVLIHGETGSGKEVVARALHQVSARRDQPFVAMNCGAVADNLIDDELFGHEPGAFTDARKSRRGRFERAHGGTLFLDEIESMSTETQIRLLRVLQERKIERLGAEREIDVDVRILAATKKDLKQMVDEGSFRADLYYRLNVASLVIPPVRDRGADAAVLFEVFVAEKAAESGRAARPIDGEMLARILSHDWPGNVREIRNAAERYVIGLPIFDDAEIVAVEGGATLPDRVAAYELRLIQGALQRSGGSIKGAMEVLGIPRKTLQDKMTKYGVRRGEFLGGNPPTDD